MKKTAIILLLIIALIAGCTTPGTDTGLKSDASRFDYVKYKEIGTLLSQWEEVIRSGDNGKFAKLVWPDVTLEFRNRKGIQTDFKGIEAVKNVRLGFLREESTADKYMLPEPHYYEDHNDSNQTYGFRFQPGGINEWLTFRKYDGVWKINHMEVILPTPGSWITNRFQALGDEDGDGFLQGQEFQLVFDMFLKSLSGPHGSNSELDELIDKNDDGFIDEDEINKVNKAFFKDGLLWFRTFSSDWAVNQLDLNGDGTLTNEEVDQIYAYMSKKLRLEDVQPAIPGLGQWLDKNSDGMTDKNEIREGYS
jgi:Ca2+-binding EF-hand superfamily protein